MKRDHKNLSIIFLNDAAVNELQVRRLLCVIYLSLSDRLHIDHEHDCEVLYIYARIECKLELEDTGTRNAERVNQVKFLTCRDLDSIIIDGEEVLDQGRGFHCRLSLLEGC